MNGLAKGFKDFFTTLLMPGIYFRRLAESYRPEKALKKAFLQGLVYGFAAGIFVLLWSFIHLNPLQEQGITFGVVMFFVLTVGSAVGVYLSGLLVKLAGLIIGFKIDYRRAVLTASSLSALLPVNYLIGVFSGIHVTLALVLSALVWGMVFFIAYFGMVDFCGAPKKRARILVSILIAGALIGWPLSAALLKTGPFVPEAVKGRIQEMEKGKIDPKAVEEVQQQLKEQLKLNR